MLTHVILRPKLLVATIFCLGFAGCASEQMTTNTVDTGSTITDLLYRRTLASIAKIRYYHGAQVLPDDFEISKATVALNDTVSVTASSTLGGAHGILIPNLGVTPSRASQNSVDLVVSNDPILLNNQAFILCVVAADLETYKDGAPSDGCLYGKYENHNGPGSWTVWVDNNNLAMTKLTYLVRALMGDKNVPVDRFIERSSSQTEQQLQKQRDDVRSAINEIEDRRTAQAHTAAPKGGSSSNPTLFIQ